MAMTYLLYLLFLVSASAAPLFAASTQRDGVVEVEASTWATIVDRQDLVVVMFYAPWCQHCKRLEPEYTKAAGELSGTVVFAKIDATEASDLADKHGVKGYPDVQLFRSGVASGEYKGAHEASAIVAWAQRKASPPVAVLNTWADLRENFLAQDADVYVLYTGEREQLFRRAAADDEAGRVAYAMTTNRELASGSTAENVQVSSTFDEEVGIMEITSATTLEELKGFVEARSTALITMFESSQEANFFARDTGPAVHALLFLDLKEGEPLLDAFSKVAATYREAARHVYVPSSERRVLEHFGLTPEDLPRLVITDLRATRSSSVLISKPENNARLPPKGETRTYKAQPMPLSEEVMSAFLQSYLQGAEQPWLRSETVTYDDAPSSSVVRLTGRTFSTAISSEKDYFVLFYAPWCGHCTALAPVWSSLAEKFAKVDSVVIAKMDATLNEVDVPGVNVRGFPTIFWFNGSGEPTLYDQPRDLPTLVKFVHDHASKVADLRTEKKGEDGEL